MGWSEDEVKITVKAYFALLDSEQRGGKINKSSMYRNLSNKYPARSPKSFELKFQNISAILYEQNLSYISGLKPRSNYQKLLKLYVLDHLDRSPLPIIEPHEILFSKLKDLIGHGSIHVSDTSTGRFGLAVEKALGITPNSDRGPDFMGIELKTKGGSSLQTLFSRTPSRYIQGNNKASMFARHCYFDAKRNRKALYTSFTSSPDSLGFSLKVEPLLVSVIRDNNTILEYDAERLEEALLSKHSQTAFMEVVPHRERDTETFTIKNVLYCKHPSIIKFLRLIRLGRIFLDFTMSETNNRIKDHGFLWRIESGALPDLYLSTESIRF